MRILVIGGGGREHALVWKLAQSEKVTKIYCAPGNPGIAKIADCVKLDLNNLESVAEFAQANNIDLTVVGPEATLVEGIADVFAAKGLKVFGPSKLAARIEGSKAFAKDLMPLRPKNMSNTKARRVLLRLTVWQPGKVWL